MAGISKTKYTSQYIDNMSFDDTYKEATVLPVEMDPSGTLVRKVSDTLATRWAAKAGDSTIIYVGEATAGSASGDSVWRIFEADTTNGTIKYADGNTNFDNEFDNRESLNYS